MPTAEAPLSSRADAQAGRGMVTGREAPEAPRLLASPSPHSGPLPAQPGYPAGLGQSNGPGAVEGGGWEQSTKGRGPRPKGGGGRPPPNNSPLNSQHRKHL